MDWLKRALAIKAPESNQVTRPTEIGPLGLERGRTAEIDSALPLILDGVSAVKPAQLSQRIFSEGVIDLGASHWLSRYYLDDNETWLQVHTTGARDGQLEALILFSYLDAVTLNSEAELARLAGPNSLIGLPEYQLEGNLYQRQWGTEQGQTELNPFVEQVTSLTESYRVQHHAMLYARDLGENSSRREFLLFSVEETEDATISFTTSLGVSLLSTDLQVF